MTDRIIRAADNAAPLLDGDGVPISELELDQVDAAIDRGASVAELAAGQRSWRFGHVIVDEAQDLTPMQWRMVARRTQGESMTVVGDLAQRSIGEPGKWSDHLPPSISSFNYQELTINYRAPAEVNKLAGAVLAELAPNLSAPKSIRSVGRHPQAIKVTSISAALPDLVAEAKKRIGEGTIAVIGTGPDEGPVGPVPGATCLTPRQAKGLEFDSVFLVEPAMLLTQDYGLSLLYVAITRSTRELCIVHEQALPDVLANAIKAENKHNTSQTHS